MFNFQLGPRSRWDLWLSLPTLMLLFLSLVIDIPAWFEWAWLIGIMLLTGIPHGATDHLIFWQKQRAAGQEPTWLSFLLPYLLQMALYGLLWFVLPSISLLIFLLLSFYHFGQSELYYIDLAEKHLLKKALYLLWGGGVMGILLLGHAVESVGYLENIVSSRYLQVSQWQALYLPTMLVIWSFWLGGMFYCYRRKLIGASELGRELLVSLLIGLSLHFCSLWIGFGLYFGLWHATKTIRMELMQLDRGSEQHFSLLDWIKQALPFSLISFIGLGLLVLTWRFWQIEIHPVFLFFVGVSMLTLPHMITLEHLYKTSR